MLNADVHLDEPGPLIRSPPYQGGLSVVRLARKKVSVLTNATYAAPSRSLIFASIAGSAVVKPTVTLLPGTSTPHVVTLVPDDASSAGTFRARRSALACSSAMGYCTGIKATGGLSTAGSVSKIEETTVEMHDLSPPEYRMRISPVTLSSIPPSHAGSFCLMRSTSTVAGSSTLGPRQLADRLAWSDRSVGPAWWLPLEPGHYLYLQRTCPSRSRRQSRLGTREPTATVAKRLFGRAWRPPCVRFGYPAERSIIPSPCQCQREFAEASRPDGRDISMSAPEVVHYRKCLAEEQFPA